MMRVIKKLLAPKYLRTAGIAYTILVTVLFLMPAGNVPVVKIPFLDKIIHVIIFTLLAFFWLSTLLKKNHTFKKAFWICIAIWFYGIIIELLQENFFDTRNADAWDIVANTTGIVLGFLVFGKLKSYLTLKN